MKQKIAYHLLKHKKIYTALIIFLLVLLAYGYFRSGPYFTVFKLQQAIYRRDYAMFMEYFDVDSVAKNNLAASLGKNSIYGDSAYDGFANKQQKTVYETIEPIMLPQTKIQTERTIKTEIEAGMLMDGYRLDGLLDYINNIRITRSGSGVTVKIDSSQKLPLELGLEKKDGRWMVSRYDIETGIPAE